MKRLFLFLAFIVLCLNHSFATHNMAGDISYQWVGDLVHPYKYHITVKTYTDFIVGFTNADRCELTIYFGDGDSTIIPRTNGPSVDCPSTHDGVMISACLPNVKMNVYETDHEFLSGNGPYYISVEDPNRKTGICNITDSENTPFKLVAELILNPFLGANNSPVYTSVPVSCGHVGFPLTYNPGVTETDGDSLYYEQVPVIDATGYFTPTASSFFWNDQSGTVIWDSPTMICDYVYGLRIVEYRRLGSNWYLIGETRQEIFARISASTGIKEDYDASVLNVFPNPSTGEINFSIGEKNAATLLSVHNELGQQILNIIPSTNVKLSSLTPGIYFYTLSGPEGILRQGKFVVSGNSVK